MGESIKEFRNICHVLIGFTLAYWMCYGADAFSFEGFANKFPIPIFCAVILTGVGMFYEFLSTVADKEVKGDVKDAFRTGVGGAIAGLTCALFPYSQTVAVITTTLSCSIILLEILRIILKRKKP